MKTPYIFALLLTLAACKKDSTTDPGISAGANDGKYLSKIAYWTPSKNTEATITEVVLDAGGNLTGLKTYITNGTAQYELNTVDKDVSGRITKISGTDKIQNVAMNYQFEYDATGNVAKATFTDGTTINYLNVYTYDSNNRLITIDERSASNTQSKTFHTYTYTGASGGPSAEKEEIRNSFPLTTNNYSMEYDDKLNPSQAAPKILYYMGMVDFYKNNMTKRSDGTNSYSYTFLYNKNGVATQKKGFTDAGLKYYYAN